jgi:hypothetical protein
MKKLLVLPALLICLSCFSQGKVKLARTPLNQTLPQDLTNRVFWNQTDLFKFNIEQLTGSIIYAEDTSGNFTRGPRIVDSGSTLQIKTVENGVRYHAKIDKGFNADLKLLIFSAGISQDQVIDVKITDLLYVFINYEKIPIDSLLKVAKAIKYPGKKYYIQGALLTSIDEQYNSKVSGNGALVGSAFGANGKVYNESEKFTEDFRISLTLIDLDKLKFFANSNNLNNAEELKNFIQASTLKNSSQVISINGFK